MTSKTRGGESDVGTDDPLLVGTVPARTPPRGRSSNGAAPATDAPQQRRAEEFEVPARRGERVADDAELVWAPTAPELTGEPTGAIDIVLPQDHAGAPTPDVAFDRAPDPVIVIPAVAPATDMPVPAPVLMPVPVPVARPVKVRRKDHPKVVRLPRRPRVRKVSRVVRSIDAWSVFKVSLVFYAAMYVVFLVAGVLLWNVAYSTGTIDNVSGFFESFGWESFEFKGGEIYHNAWIIGLFVVAALTGLNVVLATLYNLITDLVGGVRLTILEEEIVVRSATGNGRHQTTSVVVPSRKDRRRARRVHQRMARSAHPQHQNTAAQPAPAAPAAPGPGPQAG